MPARRYTPAVLAALAPRITSRDRHVLRLVWEHRVLTAPQIAQIAFDSDDTARKRMLRLHEMSVVERFQPNRPVGAGSAPFHYVLGEAGAAILAAEDGTDPADFGYRRSHALAIAYSQRLNHTIGVNGFFTNLAHTARHTTGARLDAWWAEHRCTKIWGQHARPDAYGRWTDQGDHLDFFLEYDTGTETLDKVARKLDGYAALTEATGITTPILFWLQGPRREANLRARLASRPAAHRLPIATACPSPLVHPGDDTPAGRFWLPLDIGSTRCRLAALTRARPQSTSNTPERTS
ncbi:replication-relaxation family protein [Actinomadura oligospora]|uniref:replication-relaxation family protein n=1 Tax=Actinomadura oligospora TaxID=111804 RepID=UPI0004BCEA74|nr:replication-relaxation family protein [Actinomadura oligospora]